MYKRKGFTLVEILISLAILGLGIVILFNLFLLGWQSFNYSKKLHEVSLLAHKKLEEVKAQSVISVGQSSGKENDLDWSISILPVKLDKNIELMQVDLEIKFRFQEANHQHKFVTYLANK